MVLLKAYTKDSNSTVNNVKKIDKQNYTKLKVLFSKEEVSRLKTAYSMAETPHINRRSISRI